uniref:NADH-ubiquinone oxidoreductase chain 2 n=1 Tax=Steromphala umbilicaris TaxID=2072697 RepID=A0A219YIK6_9VEST|nr:NADH dehydrogenase subunit 2 [Steromphala umbilicaris]
MFSMMPFGFLFMSILIFGTVLSLSSLHWLSIWAGLEINLMGFIPILVYSGASRETESGMKYFIMQALGSGMIMAGSLTSFSPLMTWEVTATNLTWPGLLLLVFGMMLKLGSFPFHFWLPSVMAGISWLSCLILTTWQKLAPLFLLATLLLIYPENNFITGPFILLMASFSALVGGLGGLNQTQIRALLAYSSIGHMGWMLLCITVGGSALKLYFFIYFIVSLCVFITLWASEKSFFSQSGISSLNNSKFNEITLMLMLLSLGGMPPLLGFFSKWVAIWFSSASQLTFPVFPLLLGSLVSLFYYLSLLFSLSLLSGTALTKAELLFIYPSSELPTQVTSMVKTKFSRLTATIFMLNLVGGIFMFLSLYVLEFI